MVVAFVHPRIAAKERPSTLDPRPWPSSPYPNTNPWHANNSQTRVFFSNTNIYFQCFSLIWNQWTNEKHHTKILTYLSTNNIDPLHRLGINISLNFQVVVFSDYELHNPNEFDLAYTHCNSITFIFEYEIGWHTSLWVFIVFPYVVYVHW